MPTRSARLNKWIRMLMAPACMSLALVGATAATALPGASNVSAAAPKAASAWSASLPPGTLVHPARCDQAPPQSVKDRASYSAAELARYGLPPRSPGEPFTKWAQIVRTATTRSCDYTIGTGPTFSEFKSDIWAGYVDDQSSGAVNYTETDMDYVMPGTGTAANALYGAWIGLGGGENLYYTGSRVLVQTGTYAWTDSTGVSHFNAFWENTGASNPGANVFTGFTVKPNTKYYVKVWNGTCTFIQNVATGANAGNGCAGGVNADGQTAEAIVERSYAYNAKYLAEFGSVTFDGVGVTGNGTYKGIGKFGHYYAQIYQCRLDSLGNCRRNADGSLYSPLELLASVGPISDDLNDYPNYGVKYTVTWKAFGS